MASVQCPARQEEGESQSSRRLVSKKRDNGALVSFTQGHRGLMSHRVNPCIAEKDTSMYLS